jgi:DNA-binding NarL/FixJ family response regulator
MFLSANQAPPLIGAAPHRLIMAAMLVTSNARSEAGDARSRKPDSPGLAGKTAAAKDPHPKAGAQERNKARILVVEDDPLFRQHTSQFINQQADLICCGQADSIATTPAAVAELKPNLVLMDLRLADGEAFELISLLRFQYPRAGILVLSQYDQADDVQRAMQAGAKGYITKLEVYKELLNGIRAVLRGEVYLSADLSERYLRKLQQSTAPLPGIAAPPPSGPGRYVS